jgi:hypothetical protein
VRTDAGGDYDSEPPSPVIVHGDSRLGSVIVGGAGREQHEAQCAAQSAEPVRASWLSDSARALLGPGSMRAGSLVLL